MIDSKNALNRPRLFVDMDGTLAEFHPVDTLETLCEEGYFLNLDPVPTTLRAVRLLKAQIPSVDVYILSAYLKDSLYALEEKNKWLNRFIPEIDAEHRLFCAVGEEKAKVVPGGIQDKDFLLDDYTRNLLEWSRYGMGIKLLNGINHTRKTWTGSRITAAQDPQGIVNKIARIFRGETIMDDQMPEAEPSFLQEPFSPGSLLSDFLEGERE